MELPTTIDDQEPIVGKGGILRHYVVLYGRGLGSLKDHVEGERRDVI